MGIGWQEIVALGLVAAVLAVALCRRWRIRRDARKPTGQPHRGTPPDDAPLRFYRRRH